MVHANVPVHVVHGPFKSVSDICQGPCKGASDVVHGPCEGGSDTCFYLPEVLSHVPDGYINLPMVHAIHINIGTSNACPGMVYA